MPGVRLAGSTRYDPEQLLLSSCQKLGLLTLGSSCCPVESEWFRVLPTAGVRCYCNQKLLGPHLSVSGVRLWLHPKVLLGRVVQPWLALGVPSWLAYLCALDAAPTSLCFLFFRKTAGEFSLVALGFVLSGKKLPCRATTTPQLQVCALLAAPSLLTAVTCWGCRLCVHLFPGQVSTCLLHPRSMNMPGVSLAGSTRYVCT